MATQLSFVAPIGPFFDRLDTFSIARLLKITLVLLFFGETHYLPSLRASLGRELTQRRFSSAQIGPFLMQKSDPPASGLKNLTWLQSRRLSRSVNNFVARIRSRRRIVICGKCNNKSNRLRRDKHATLPTVQVPPRCSAVPTSVANPHPPSGQGRTAFLHQNWTDLGGPATALCELPAKRGSKR